MPGTFRLRGRCAGTVTQTQTPRQCPLPLPLATLPAREKAQPSLQLLCEAGTESRRALQPSGGARDAWNACKLATWPAYCSTGPNDGEGSLKGAALTPCRNATALPLKNTPFFETTACCKLPLLGLATRVTQPVPEQLDTASICTLVTRNTHTAQPGSKLGGAEATLPLNSDILCNRALHLRRIYSPRA